MEFGHHIRAYQAEILSFLAELVAVPSVAAPDSPLPGKPYGEGAARALSLVLEKASSFGLSVKNVGNYAGHAEYPCGKDGIAAVLCHVDVVPPGPGWAADPYTLTAKDGLLYGRGVLDDKGPAVIALYCMKALRDHGVAGKRSIRCIFGAGEEVGMEDLAHYFAEEPLPDLAFTPDGAYGICNREKGILHIALQGENRPSVVRSFTAGEVFNAVPARAEAVVACAVEQAAALRLAAEQAKEPCTVSYDGETGTAQLVMEGQAAHAREPEQGRNAAMHLLWLLVQVFGGEQLGCLLRFLAENIGLETDGGGLGIRQSDGPSGPLTLNVGMVRAGGTQGDLAGIDIRYPVTADGEAIIRQIEGRLAAAGLCCRVVSHPRPLYTKENSPLVSVLRLAYRSATGREPTLYSTGGGSYARCVPGRCVAFGPLFPDEPDRHIHQSGEHVDGTLFFRHAEICLEAMYRMVMAD